MRLTRRTWTIGAIGVTLAVAAPVLASPIPAVGAAVVFGWIIARQLIVVGQFQATVDNTTISITPAASTAQVGTDIPVTVTVERPLAAAGTVQTVTIGLPVAAKPRPETEREVTLSIGETQATTTIMLSVPTAGRMAFPEPQWQLIDKRDMFTETFSRGPTPTVTIEAETMQEIHVGRGGSEVSAFGQYNTDETGEGLTPAEIRKYIIGEPADRIDWKATARLPETYVREFEAESDREITLIVDHRSQTVDEDDNNTQLAYLREVALSILSNAESGGDALGLLTVGDEGLTTVIPPTQNERDHTRIREQLLTLTPTTNTPPTSSVDLSHPDTSRDLLEKLGDEESKFSSILQDFAEIAPSYVERFETSPLYGAIEYIQSAPFNGQLTIILTTDEERQQLHYIAQEAANNTTVLLFIAPAVLFDMDSLADVEAAYHQYLSFEEFRTELERTDSVVAYEVGPSERLATLIASQQSQNTAKQTPTGGAR